MDCTRALRGSTRPLVSPELSLKIIIIIELNVFNYRLWIGNICELPPNQDGAVLIGVLCFNCTSGLLILSEDLVLPSSIASTYRGIYEKRIPKTRTAPTTNLFGVL